MVITHLPRDFLGLSNKNSGLLRPEFLCLSRIFIFRVEISKYVIKM